MLAGKGGKPDLAIQSRALAYTGAFNLSGDKMSNDTKNDDGSPKFGKLLIVLVGAVVFCGLLTWIMGTYFPDFPS